MSTEDLLESLGRKLNRRSLLKRAGAAAVGAALALMGLPAEASAYPIHCCNLCFAPSTQCTGCTCIWCWHCTEAGQVWQCCECNSVDSTCGDSCYHVTCSYYKKRNVAPPAAAA